MVAGRVPILRQHHVAEAAGQAIDRRHDFIAVRDGKIAIRTKVILNIDDQQDVAVLERTLLPPVPERVGALATSVAMRTIISTDRTG